MEYKHCCVIDGLRFYKTFVLVLLVENEEHQQEEQVQYYTLLAGESLVDAAPPVMRPYAGAVGLITPRWDTDTAAWVEAASEEEIADWEAEHPAPDVPELPGSSGDLEKRVTSLEANSATKEDVQAVWDQMAAAYNEGVQEA